jgi:hypothetical protein
MVSNERGEHLVLDTRTKLALVLCRRNHGNASRVRIFCGERQLTGRVVLVVRLSSGPPYPRGASASDGNGIDGASMPFPRH